MEETIEILGGNIGTEQLTLQPEDLYDVAHGTKITWIIKTSEVYSFRIKKKKDSEGVFSYWGSLPREHTTGEGSGIIDKKSNRETRYSYSIFWRAEEGGKEFEHDPIIAVKPHPFLPDPTPNPKIIIGVVVGVVAALSIIFLLKKRKKDKWRDYSQNADF